MLFALESQDGVVLAETSEERFNEAMRYVIDDTMACGSSEFFVG